MMQRTRSQWGGLLVTRLLVIASLAILWTLGFAGTAAAQETDHLACVSVKDNKDAVPDGPVPVAISDILDDEFSDCVVKKIKMSTLSVRIAKDGGDDPIAGQAAAEAYGCYKIKCGDGASDGSLNVEDQFATRVVQRKKLRTICTPVELNGDVP